MEMEKDFDEYVTFTVTDKNGAEVEMAVVDEFDFEDDHAHAFLWTINTGATMRHSFL